MRSDEKKEEDRFNRSDDDVMIPGGGGESEAKQATHPHVVGAPSLGGQRI